MRLDAYLTGKSDVKSRTVAKRLIEDGQVTVNGVIVKKPSFSITSEETVRYTLPSPPAIPEDRNHEIDLPILYEDEACMVIGKPSGLIMHPGSGTKPGDITLLSALKPLFAERRLPFSESTVLVHRLDKDTTGCLLVAKNPEAHQALQQQFMDRETTKTYLALVFGVPKKSEAVIDIPIGRDTGQRTRMSVHRTSSSRDAKTAYKTLFSVDGVSLLQCTILTGRTHQIRVHLSALHHPVLGDPTYGSLESSDMSKELGVESIMLHAWKLSFLSPDTNKEVKVTAPPPTESVKLFQRLGLDRLP
ncbi:MAG: RluA family pseudouridine synthase [Candidatus Peribacteraceae bacterium]